MKRPIILAVGMAITVITADAHAKFSADECNNLWKCCEPYRQDDDLVSGYDECCMGYDYDMDLYTACTNVCSNGNSMQYCDLGSEITTCKPGQGYDSLHNVCSTCPSGEYSIYETLESGYDETLLIPNYYCEPCPIFRENDTIINPSSTNNVQAITSCYLPTGATATDTTGSYTFTNNCYYSN